MTDMRYEQAAPVQAAIDALRDIPADDAWVIVDANEAAGATVSGNPAGLARLALVLLKCSQDDDAAREYRSAGAAMHDLQSLRRRGLVFDEVNLLEQPPHVEPDKGRRAQFKDLVGVVGCAVAILVVGTLVLLGLGVVTGFIRTVP